MHGERMKPISPLPGPAEPTPRDVKYLPLTAPGSVPVAELPTPADYRKTTPAILGPPQVDEKSRIFSRKRVVIGFGVAAALHVGLGLAWWLTPSLRLKVGYAPERWVPVLSLPKPPPEPPRSEAAPPAATPTTSAVSPATPRKKRGKSHARTSVPRTS
jgi:hypothetical protein